MQELVETVFEYCAEIKNNRTILTAYKHAQGEMVELDSAICAEIQDVAIDEDGILGEAVDVITCMLDIIWQAGYTKKEILETAIRKCDKWKYKYENHCYG